MPSLKPKRRPPLLIAFPCARTSPEEAIAYASEQAGAWLQEQNPRLLSMSTNLTYAADLWCYVITIAWVIDDELLVAPIDRAHGTRW